LTPLRVEQDRAFFGLWKQTNAFPIYKAAQLMGRALACGITFAKMPLWLEYASSVVDTSLDHQLCGRRRSASYGVREDEA
jgi:hypothetical protein